MQIGDIVSGYGDETGIYLNIISRVGDDTVDIETKFFEPTHPDFAWAIETLNSVSS